MPFDLKPTESVRDLAKKAATGNRPASIEQLPVSPCNAARQNHAVPLSDPRDGDTDGHMGIVKARAEQVSNGTASAKYAATSSFTNQSLETLPDGASEITLS